MLKRWAFYLWESYNPIQRILLIGLLAFAIHNTLNIMNHFSVFSNIQEFIISAVNVFFIMLYIRVNDEVKDYEIDKEFFPDRPVPSGRISLKDLSILNWVIIIILFLTNILWHKTIFEFIFTFAVFFLAANDFYISNILSKNRLLAFAVFVPVYFILIMFVIAICLKTLNLSIYTKENFLVAIWFLLPLVIFELARKTRSPEEDKDGYQSYSKLLGYRKATLALTVCILFHLLLLLYSLNGWKIALPVVVLFAIFNIVFVGKCLYFTMHIPVKNTSIRKYGALYMLLTYLLIVVNPVFG